MFKKSAVMVLMTFLVFAVSAQAAQVVSIGTAPAGGSWYANGGAIADIITKYVDGVTGIAEVTGAAVENVKLLGTKKVEMGITINAICNAGYLGKPPFKEKYPNLRILLSSFQKGYLQIFALKNSPIQYIDELKGKRVAVGPAGHGSLVRLKEVFKALGWGFSFKAIDPVYLPYKQAVTLLTDKRVDAAVLYMAPPAPVIKEAEITNPIKVLRLRDEQRQAILKTFKHYLPVTINQSAYKSLDEDIPTIATPNVVMVDADLEEALVYKITKAIFEHIDIFRGSHPSVKKFSIQDAVVKGIVPYHPGAMKYYKEQGVW